MTQYITAKTFEDFVCNQKELINVLNHSMTNLSENVGEIKGDMKAMKVDVNSTKKIQGWIVGLLGTIATGVTIGLLLK
jgi:t-SNARE complex subunit (syntaxin)